MVQLNDRVGVGTTTVGTGTVALGSGLVAGTRPNQGQWLTFAQAGLINGQTVRYLVLDSNGAWEYGPGVYGDVTAWDPASSLAVTLSADNLTVTNTGAADVNQGSQVADELGKTVGKYYFEVTILTLGAGGNRGMGFGSTATTIAGMGNGANIGIMEFIGTGNIWQNSGNTGLTLGARAVNDVIGLAVDLDNRRGWIRVAPSGNWNGSGTATPSTPSTGLAIAAGVMVPYATFGGVAGAPGCSFRANFGASAFTGAVPAGFTPGWS